MVRVYKHYDFTAMTDASLVGKRVSMSSYPGAALSWAVGWAGWGLRQGVSGLRFGGYGVKILGFGLRVGGCGVETR
eukprot:364734-Chlamydomonas_euryale.AAC.1